MPSSENFKVHLSVDGGWTLIGFYNEPGLGYFYPEHTYNESGELYKQLGKAVSKNKESSSLGETAESQLCMAFPDLEELSVRCPSCNKMNLLMDVIMHLNDTHRMSREDIADWLETLDADLTFKEKDVSSI